MTHLPRLRWILLALFALLRCGIAQATEATVVGDTFVDINHTTTNYGTAEAVGVGNGRTALIQFDLGSLPAGTTASQIAKATLRLYVETISTKAVVQVQPVTSAWSESTVMAPPSPAWVRAWPRSHPPPSTNSSMWISPLWCRAG